MTSHDRLSFPAERKAVQIGPLPLSSTSAVWVAVSLQSVALKHDRVRRVVFCGARLVLKGVIYFTTNPLLEPQRLAFSI